MYRLVQAKKSLFWGQKFCKIATLQVWKQIFGHKMDCNLPFLANNIDSTSRDELSFERQ